MNQIVIVNKVIKKKMNKIQMQYHNMKNKKLMKINKSTTQKQRKNQKMQNIY